MSCNSLFTFDVGLEGTISHNKVNCSGNFSVGGYTTPGWTTTTTIPAVSHWNKNNICVPTFAVNCGTNGWTQTCTNSWFGSNQWCVTYPKIGCSTSTNECGATTAVFTETFTHPTNRHIYAGIPLWPATNVSGSAIIDIETKAAVKIIIPPPPGSSPVISVESAKFTFEEINLNFSAGSVTIPVNIPITTSVILEVNSAGEFSAIVPIPEADFSNTTNETIPVVGEITYGISGSAYLLLCATPEPPSSFINVVFDVMYSVSCNNPITNEEISFNTNFAVLCPMSPS
jgi:hypothetical protein